MLLALSVSLQFLRKTYKLVGGEEGEENGRGGEEGEMGEEERRGRGYLRFFIKRRCASALIRHVFRHAVKQLFNVCMFV